ncbi:vacuolar protein sorting-associated protein 45-like protein [Leishmania major strain Friedlin]|uniref:Vacuolar protein sorting-associated protein 45-like protein n=1 Tax=Leishmania major TaxID=5664 RepID=Q4Q1J8_LEIMA|nr:vacuolar protein sorting-associated protein 45-like protein [Leishmania major strain Friedlin]CAG9583752.1 Sec1_family [Leishmania major strain Friedlin]CAJ09181.1 vacuolar protein sorting-associated protein 45-like protein [Leishmania major strain Friedlin]|eukprot:XP_001686800.1 vacuolar protein sorting-associated protein 45-like protein [Leishmania major strain Friedlin]
MNRILPCDTNMKVLLVDDGALPMIATAFSQTELLKHGVYLVESLNSAARQRNLMKMLRCYILLRPSLTSVEAACVELRMAKYRSYHIFFCGATSAEMLDRLANADNDSLVEEVQEVFCDFNAINKDAFVLETPPPQSLVSSFLSASQVRRLAEGLASLMVAQRRRPRIRYQKNSPFVQRLASELVNVLKSDPELYDYPARDTVLLLLDRNDDPLTPLLTPWTYQAMLHEHIGLRSNTLQLPADVQGAEKEGYVFSEHDDTFFANNMFNNWGDLCNNVKRYVDQCKEALNLDRPTATLEELKAFMQKIPQTKSLTGSVTKHTTVTTYLSGVLKKRNLLEISLLEQDMIASSDQSNHWTRLQSFASRPSTSQEDLTRLCLIYHLRYEKSRGTSQVAPYLDRVNSNYALLLSKLRQYYGLHRNTDRLFAATGVMAKIVKTFVDVGNIYTQHEPVLKRTLQQLYSGQLDTAFYPYLEQLTSSSGGGGVANAEHKPMEVIVYMCGGYTFEEAALVHGINARTAYKPADAASFAAGGSSIKASIGGEAVLNTHSFLSLLDQLSPS